jgi:hypothetical protein
MNKQVNSLLSNCHKDYKKGIDLLINVLFIRCHGPLFGKGTIATTPLIVSTSQLVLILIIPLLTLHFFT